jgi:integrase/recombinase XerC
VSTQQAQKGSLLEGFIEYLRYTKHYSDYTVRSYNSDMEFFCEFLLGTRGETERQNATPMTGTVDEQLIAADISIFREFLGYLRKQNYQPSTIRRKLATLRTFMKFLIRSAKRPDNPLVTMRTARVSSKKPRCITPEQMAKLLAAPSGSAFLTVRDKAMLEILCSSGIRVGELVALEMKDIDLNEGVLLVRCKGRKDRLVPIGSSAIAATQRYFEMRQSRRPQSEPEDKVFLNKRGKLLHTRSVRGRLDMYLAQAGLDLEISPQTLRHSFAAHLLANGADVCSVQQLLGHQHKNSTHIYAFVDLTSNASPTKKSIASLSG